MFADAEPTACHPAGVIGVVSRGDQVVELGERADVRHRHHVAPTEPADLSFHATLLVSALDAGLAEERVESVVGAQRDEPFGLGAVTAPQHPLDRRLQVVITHPARHPTEVGEGADMTVEERLLGFVGIHAVEALR